VKGHGTRDLGIRAPSAPPSRPNWSGWCRVRCSLALDACRRGDYAAALIEGEAITPLHLAWSALDRAVALARLGRLADARVAACELAAIARDPRAVVSRLTADQALVDDLVEALALAGLG
jgi:hypothetical protein